MPRYFFDVRKGAGLVADKEGSELPDIEAAQYEAILSLADMSKDHVAGNGPRHLSVEVRDEHSRPILEAILTFEVKQLA